MSLQPCMPLQSQGYRVDRELAEGCAYLRDGCLGCNGCADRRDEVQIRHVDVERRSGRNGRCGTDLKASDCSKCALRVWLDGVVKGELSAGIVMVAEGLARVNLGRGDRRGGRMDGNVDVAFLELAGDTEAIVVLLVSLIARFEDQSYRPFISCRGHWGIECDAGIDRGNLESGNEEKSLRLVLSRGSGAGVNRHGGAGDRIDERTRRRSYTDLRI